MKPPFPLITAHTGCMGTPDHSLESFRAAAEYGADIVEDDIRATKDGALVLSHDDVLPLPDGGRIRVSALTLRELSAFPNIRIVELQQLLKLVKEAGLQMNLDVKADDVLEPLAELIAGLDMADQVFLSGCEYPRAALAESRAPALRKLLNVQVGSFVSKPYEEAVREACEEARRAGCFGLNVPYPLVNATLVEVAGNAGLPLYVWDVDEPERMSRCAEWGVRSITTRRLAVLQALKAGWTRSSAADGP